MAEYNIVKHCGLCKVRFVVGKARAREHYCGACQIKIDKQRKSEGKQ